MYHFVIMHTTYKLNTVYKYIPFTMLLIMIVLMILNIVVVFFLSIPTWEVVYRHPFHPPPSYV